MKKRQPIYKEDHALIPLTLEQFAIVDIDKAEWLARWNWQASIRASDVRVCRTEHCGSSKRKVYMHRALMENFVGESAGLVIDHIDGNPLNNRMSNLRYCTQSENCRNRDGVINAKGYCWMPAQQLWQAYYINKKGERLYSYHKKEIDARNTAQAYRRGE